MTIPSDVERIYAQIAANELSVFDNGGGGGRLWFSVRGVVWQLYRGTSLREMSSAQRLPTAIVNWLAEMTPQHAAALQKGRTLVAGLEEAEAAIQGGQWCWHSDDQAVVKHAELGVLRMMFHGTELRFLSTSHKLFTRSMLVEALNRNRLQIRPPSPQIQAAFDREIQVIASEYQRLCAQRHMLCIRQSAYSRIIVQLNRSWLWISVDEHLQFDPDAILNPHSLVMEEHRVLEQLLEQHTAKHRTWTLEEIPTHLRESLKRLEAHFSMTKAEIIDRYFHNLQQGGTISGGPTTDQSWTIRWDGDGYTISSYEPGEDGHLRPITEEISADKIRDMLSTYHMFGLHRLPS